MLGRGLCILIAFVAPLALARADIMPPRLARPDAPPGEPPGPDQADIRGLSVVKLWRSRRWHIHLKDCAATQPACQGRRLPKGDTCSVIGIDGRPVIGGDIASLIAADQAAKGRSLKLQLEDCGGLAELVLHP
jgi:hypothetical protein